MTVAILARGQNTALPPAASYSVVVSHAAGPEVDLVAFLLDEDGRAPGDAAMVFYNQPDGAGARWSPPETAGGVTRHRLDVTPGGWAGTTARVRIGLTVAGGTFAGVPGLRAALHGPAGELYTLDLGRPDVQDALIVGDVYRHRDAIKVRCVGDGFTDGLRGLITDVGLTVDDEPPVPAQPVVTLTKARQISLAKPAAGASSVDLRKYAVAVSLVKSGLDARTFRVVLAIDCSGSTKKLFRSGVMQRSLERMVVIADLLDDNGEMEVWFFGDYPVRSAPVRVATAADYLDRQAADKKRAEGGNFEPRVMKEILDWTAAEPSPHPTLVLFWSDGGVHAEKQITELLVRASNRPVYWMFLGLGVADYGVLARLDDVRGGVVDNAGFLPIDDIDLLSDDDLYGQIFGTFVSRWHSAATAAGIVT
ncbi:VWA domain-containing protein [Dactylosporangium aurantiacum]|uniref:VWA domain-containing protein n=1 Tax=Dactylosporangium aurantiacum TaxID=35754 RepID=A0A9Q9IJ16_9ACTN|nr:VWA domain-containing protein [Dactylosporangium aurantiacum]MDG6107481.1 VWA domain-containing protein [Dactylosporangium aurantiacum]UWZ54274.1 VWA domain-containing protein [Dactylosporangium aurantiacum]